MGCRLAPRRHARLGIAWRHARRKVERRAGGGTAGPLDWHRHPAAAKCLRRAGRIWILAGVEGIAAATAPARLLNDRRGARDLLLRIALLRLLRISALRLAIAAPRLRVAALLRIASLSGLSVAARGGLRRWHDGDVRLVTCLRSRRSRRGPELPQPLLELTVAILQFLVLAGERPKLLFQLLDSQLRVLIIRLCKSLRRQRKRHGDGRGTGHF